VALSSPGQAAALPKSERAAAKRLLMAPVHFGRLEDSLLEGLLFEESLRGF
jgi:hypothetical protein